VVAESASSTTTVDSGIAQKDVPLAIVGIRQGVLKAVRERLLALGVSRA
jgi:hypothetical protein